MKTKQSNKKYALLGIQFTSFMVTPVLVCVLGGSYVQKKYNLGDWFMNACVALAVILLITNLISFARMAIKLSESDKKSQVDEDENKPRN